MQREVETYFLNASNSEGALRPSGGGVIGGDTQWLSGPTPSPVAAWTHVAMTYDGSNMRIFVNGAQVASRADERRDPDQQQSAVDRWQQPVRRVLRGSHRRGARLQPRADLDRDHDRHERVDRADLAGLGPAVAAVRRDRDACVEQPGESELEPRDRQSGRRPATGSSAASAPPARTSPRWGRRPGPRSTTPASRARAPIATACGPSTCPATSAATRRSSRRPRRRPRTRPLHRPPRGWPRRWSAPLRSISTGPRPRTTWA